MSLKKGTLEVVAGCMFSGKTEELIRLLHRSEIAGKKILVLKPKTDSRTAGEIAARGKEYASSPNFKKSKSFPAFPVATYEEAVHLIHVYGPDVLGIDEAQFFPEWIIPLVEEIMQQNSDRDFNVIVAGLDLDAWNKPFGVMPYLLSFADEVQKETAICFVCKKRPAVFTQKLISSDRQVEVGDFEIYQARCRVCHELPKSA